MARVRYITDIQQTWINKKTFSLMSPLCDGRMAGMSAVLFLPSFLSKLAQPHKEIKSRVYWKGYLETWKGMLDMWSTKPTL